MKLSGFLGSFLLLIDSLDHVENIDTNFAIVSQTALKTY